MWVRFNVGSRGQTGRVIEAENWLVALGRALEADGGLDTVERLGCEVLKNGTVIVRDAATGAGWVVRSEGASESVDGWAEELEVAEEQDAAAPSPYQAVLDAENPVAACAVALAIGREAVGAEGGAVWQVVDEGLWITVAAGLRGAKLAGLVLPAGVGIAASVVRTGHIVMLADATSDARHFAEPDRLVGAASREVLCVPVWRGNTVVGAIELTELTEGSRFSRQGMHEIRALAVALSSRLSRAA